MRGAARDRNHDGRKVAASGVRGIRLIASNADLAGILARLRDIVGSLHAHQRVHVHTERLLDAQSHLTGQVGIPVQEIRQSRSRHAEHLGRGRDREPVSLDDLGLDEVAGVNRVVHSHNRSPFSSALKLFEEFSSYRRRKPLCAMLRTLIRDL